MGVRSIGLIAIAVVGTAYALTLWLAGSGAEGREVRARIEDATNLNVGAPVFVAGLEVGRIESRKLKGSYAELTLNIKHSITLGKDAVLIKRTPSLLSGPILEIDPGDPVNAGVIRSGGEIVRIQEAGVGKSPMDSIAEAMPGIQEGSRELRDDIRRIRSDVNNTWMGRLRRLSRDVDEFSHDLSGGLRSVDEGVASAEDAVGGFDAKKEIGARVDSAARGAAKLRQQTVGWRRDVEELGRDTRERIDAFDIEENEGLRDFIREVKKVDQGEGTLGELVNDDSLAQSIEDGVGAVSGAVKTLTDWQMKVGLRAEYNVRAGIPRYYLTIRARRRPDSYYLLAFEKSGRGDRPEVSLVYDPGLGRYRQDVLIREKVRITLQWAKQLGALTLRGGVKDSTMGVGADLHFFGEDLELSTDLFDIAFDQNPRLKVASAYRAFGHLYVLAGVDDVLNPPGTLNIEPINTNVPIQFEEFQYGRDYFFGYALRFDDRDLAALLTVGSDALASVVSD